MESDMSPEERNALQQVEVPRDDDAFEIPRKLPYIVCIIDELADLMMVAPAILRPVSRVLLSLHALPGSTLFWLLSVRR